MAHHRVLCGGKDDSDSEDRDDEAEEGDDDTCVENQKVPLNYHCLPLEPLLDLIKVNFVKHVIDLTPTPCPLALALVERGISYAAFCASEKQKKFLETQLLRGILDGVQTPGSKLYDMRFAATAGSPSKIKSKIKSESESQSQSQSRSNSKSKSKSNSKRKSKSKGKRKRKRKRERERQNK